jgi:hypothetical protein
MLSPFIFYLRPVSYPDETGRITDIFPISFAAGKIWRVIGIILCAPFMLIEIGHIGLFLGYQMENLVFNVSANLACVFIDRLHELASNQPKLKS